MKNQACEIVIVLDRSGSMSSIKTDTEGGFNTFLAEQKAAPGEAFISLYQFDDVYETVYEGKKIADAPSLHLHPRGSTALFDAMGKTLATALGRITDDKRKVIFLTMTDGGENASREHTSKSVGDLINKAKARGWQCLFIGANQDAILAAAAFNIGAAGALNMAANPVGTQSLYQSLSANTKAYRSGASVNMNWSATDRDAQNKAMNKTA